MSKNNFSRESIDQDSLSKWFEFFYDLMKTYQASFYIAYAPNNIYYFISSFIIIRSLFIRLLDLINFILLEITHFFFIYCYTYIYKICPPNIFHIVQTLLLNSFLYNTYI